MATVTKRKWKKPDGSTGETWVVRYKAADGTRPAQSFKRKRDADAHRLKVETELEAGEHVTASDALTVKVCCEGFLAVAERRLEARQIGVSRIKVYRFALDKYVVPILGKKRLKDLQWSDLELLQSKMAHLSLRTREAYFTVLKMVEDYAIKRGHLKKPVVRDFRRDVGWVKVEPIRTFNAEQASHLLRIVAEDPPFRIRRVKSLAICAVYLAACCGLRRGEIMGLTLDSLDFANGVIRVRNNLTQWDVLKGTKTDSGMRDVPMPAALAALLKAWVGDFYIVNDRRLVFRTRKNLAIGAGNWTTHYWHPLLKKAGLWSDAGDQFHFHALRHFAASWMIEHGLALPDVASLMGHAKFDMTLQVYAHPIIGGHRRHDAFERMTGALITGGQAAA